jgi:hypothetical protein
MSWERVALILEEGDWKMLSELAGGLEKHVTKAFLAYAAKETRFPYIVPATTTNFNRPAVSGYGREVVCHIEVDACAKLRSLGGSFRERAWDAVRYYLTNLYRLKSD